MNSENFYLQIKKLMTRLTESAAEAHIDRVPLELLKERLERQKLRVAIFGQFSAGKSLFLNTILERLDLLPFDMTPTTRVITELIYDEEEKVEILYRDGTLSRRLTLADYTQLQEVGNIKKVFISVPSKILQQITFIDTPGLGDPDSIPLDLIYEEIPAADVVVLLTPALRPLSQEEQIFIREKVRPRDTSKIVLILNQVDLIDNEQLDKVQDRVKLIGETLITKPVIYTYSARQAYLGLKGRNQVLLAGANFLTVKKLFTEEVLEQQNSLMQAGLINQALDAVEMLENSLHRRRQLASATAEEIQKAVLEFENSRARATETVNRLQRRATSRLKDVGEFYHTGIKRFENRLQEEIPSQIIKLGKAEETREYLSPYLEYICRLFLEEYNEELIFRVNVVLSKVYEEMSLEMKELLQGLNLELDYGIAEMTRMKMESPAWQKIGTIATLAGAAALISGNLGLGLIMIGANEALRRFSKEKQRQLENRALTEAVHIMIRETVNQFEDSFQAHYHKMTANILSWIDKSWHEQLAVLETELMSAQNSREKLFSEQISEEKKLLAFEEALQLAAREFNSLVDNIVQSDSYAVDGAKRCEDSDSEYVALTVEAVEAVEAVAEELKKGKNDESDDEKTAPRVSKKVREHIMSLLNGK